MIGRVADTYFAGSEMEDLQLAQKIEYLLDEILPVIGKSRVKQEIIIDEFSESDDDYWKTIVKVSISCHSFLEWNL